ncbi:uncharacterized protein TNCV_1064241 [Trichonephila clavipes]|nr:uncharacterized protein TNCV_1064241 [Trichonephila clavipes]
MAALVSEYTLEFFTLLNARSKKELIEWCMKEGLIASSYECPECNEQMGLNERKSVVLDGFEWRCRKKGGGRFREKDTASVFEVFRAIFQTENHFSRIGSREIGLWESASVGFFPGFRIGITTAVFHAFGKYLSLNMLY